MIKFTEHQVDLIDEVLTKDLLMLQECDLMDYSLLIIVINNSIEGKKDLERIYEETSLIRRIFRSSDNKYIYCIGIIDYLQKYNFKKKFEHKLKKIIHDNKASAVDSKLYAFRLKKFVDNQILGI